MHPFRFVGAVLDDGSINYHCPCVSGTVGLLTGPCGFEFRQLHKCLLTSESKGVECGDQWQQFRSCYSQNLAPASEDNQPEQDTSTSKDS